MTKLSDERLRSYASMTEPFLENEDEQQAMAAELLLARAVVEAVRRDIARNGTDTIEEMAAALSAYDTGVPT